MKKLSLLIGLLVLSVTTLIGQTKVITGTVTSADEGRDPLPGVTVQVKGTSIGTLTDVYGKYSLNAPESARTIVFSFIGMKTIEVEISGRNVIDAALATDMVGLNEVIVSAFGIKRNANEIGSAITTIDNELITQAKATDAASAMAGKIAGLQINTVNASVNPDVRVVLRGNRSFLGNNQALLVLDGIPVNLAYLSTINPNDIASMNVLKGGNAAALYGSEAANGVIIVTTKAGSRDKTSIQVSSTVTFDKVSYFPSLQNRFGSGSGSDNYGNPNYEPFENQCWGDEFDGTMRQIGLPDENGEKQMVQYSARPNELGDFWDTGITFQNDVSFSSGNESSTIYIAVQDVKIKGVVPGDEARRNVFRFNGSKTYKGFTASASVNYTIRTTDVSRSGVYWNVLNTPMQIPLTSYKDWSGKYYDTDGNPVTNWADIDHYYNAYYPNPYEQLERLRQETRRDYFTGIVTLEQKVTKWLKFEVKGSIAPNFLRYENKNFSRTYSPYGLLMYTLNGRSVSRTKNLSAYTVGENMGFRFTTDALMTVEHKFNDISVRAIAGVTTRDSFGKSGEHVAATLEIDDFFNIKNRVGELGGSASWNQSRNIGLFGDLTIGYKNLAYLHASGRNDWSSLLDPSQWSFFYPGVDASIILSELIPGIKGDLINYMKLRGGVSKVGSINIGVYSLENTFGVASNFPFGSLSAYTVGNTLNNRYIEPEFTLSREIGLDISFLNNRISTGITAYQTNTTNQTVNMTVSSATGYTNSKINAGEMLNKGLEFELKTTPIATPNWRWDFNANYAYWYNKVVSLAGDLDEISLGNTVYAIQGMPFPTIKVTQFTRDPQGRVIVDGVTGMPTIDAQTVPRGQTVPKHLIGLQSSFSWKNLSLAISADYRGGHIFRSDLYYDLLFAGVGEFSAVTGRERFVFPNSVINTGTAEDPVYTPNTNITIQDGGAAFWTSTMRNLSYYAVNSAAVWKVREVSLTYDVPQSFLGFTNNVVKGLSVGVVGRNLFMFLPKNNLYTDPEFGTGTGNDVGRSTSDQTPATRTYGFNVTVSF